MKRKPGNSTSILLSALAVGLLLPSAAVGAETHWTCDRGSWSNSSCWSDGVPSGEDNAYINNGGLAVIDGPAELYSLTLGQLSWDGGAVQMNAGSLNAGAEWIGYRGGGYFEQNGGTNTVRGLLGVSWCGNIKGSFCSGTYVLNDGELSVGFQEQIANGGSGSFIQEGGTHSIGQSLWIGLWDGWGMYRLSAGSLFVPRQNIGNDFGKGNFEQTGGSNGSAEARTNLYLGLNPEAEGTYRLEDGDLYATNLYVGRDGKGEFWQTGGTVDVSSDLTLGHRPGSKGTYEIRGGVLRAPVSVGSEGTGKFTSSGGMVDADHFSVGSHGTVYARFSDQERSVRADDLMLESGSTLHLMADYYVGDLSVQEWGDYTETIIAHGSRTGKFSDEPAAGIHIGYGVFTTDQGANCQAVTYDADGVKVDLFQAAPGDTNGDRRFDAVDVQRILSCDTFPNLRAADWTCGDFVGEMIQGRYSPPDRRCDGLDIQAIMATALYPYLDRPYDDPDCLKQNAAATADPPAAAAELLLYPEGHELAGTLMIDPDGLTINGYVIRSESGIFTGQPANNLGWFQEDADGQISGNMGFELIGEHSLGAVVGRLSLNPVEDLTFTYTIQGVPGTFVGNLAMVPEPSTLILLAMGAVGLLAYAWRTRSAA